jgi:hypothetical protein
MPPIKSGKPDVKPDAPTHVKGINVGNQPGQLAKQKGHLEDGRVTSERSTGINPKGRNPIDPRMPNLPPA